MNAPQPDDTAMERAREEQRAADEARSAKAEANWRDQASRIEEGMADAVDRAAEMGDRVEPSTLPPDRRPEPSEETGGGPRRADPDAERRPRNT